jgi:hypothetical protein
MKHLPKRFKPTLESLLKDSQVLTGKDLLQKAKAKELELELFNKSVEFEERNRKNNSTKTSS